MFKSAAWLACAVMSGLTAAAYTSPVTVYFGGASTTFNGNPVTVTPFDGTYIEVGNVKHGSRSGLPGSATSGTIAFSCLADCCRVTARQRIRG